jgi:NAD(P)H-dependent flavin oxidoreductase YrpB (nitropropane dioxygenase family)
MPYPPAAPCRRGSRRAEMAAVAGADVLVAQGTEAGGHSPGTGAPDFGQLQQRTSAEARESVT